MDLGENDWEPSYKNASRPGLISFKSYGPQQTHLTTNMEHFPRQIIGQPRTAPRKKYLKEKMEAELRKQIWEEQNKPAEALINYGKISLYKEDFPYPVGFVPADDVIDPKELEKYDLYTDPARSIYLDQISKIKRELPNKDLNCVFRKQAFFCKPPWAELE